MKQISTATLLFFFASLGPAEATFLKPDHYANQCAELAFEVAYENRKLVKDEFEYSAPNIVQYESGSAIVDQSIFLEEERLLFNKSKEFICGFDKNGMIVDYQDPFNEDDVFTLDEPLMYDIEPGDYVDVQDENCNSIEVTKKMALEIGAGAAIGTILGVAGGIIAVPLSGGVVVASALSGGALSGTLQGSLKGLGTGAIKSVYHCISK